MDRTKRMSRPGQQYHGRGLDPTNVPRRREQEEAARDFQPPGLRMPGNPRNALGPEEEMRWQREEQVYENTYLDGRGVGIPGTGVNYQRVRPTPAQLQMQSPQLAQDAALQQDLRWSLAGPPGPLTQPPSGIVMDRGIEASSPRGPNGEPGSWPMAPNQPPAMEDLRYTQTPMPADADAMVTGMVLGDPSQATLPRPNQMRSLYSSFGTPPVTPR